MARRGDSGLEMNFDGLADSVTNLVGNMILLVVLVFGVSSERQEQVEELPPIYDVPVEPPPRPIPPGSRSVNELIVEAEGLQAQLAQVSQELTEMESRWPELRRRAEEMIEKARTLSSNAK